MRRRRLLASLAVFFFVMTVMSGGAWATPVITSGLVAAYEFNGNANDVSGNGNNGVVNGATLTADRFGNAGSAYSFDGVDDYIDLGAQNFGSAMSASLWVNFLNITEEGQNIFNKADGDLGPGDISVERTIALGMLNQGAEHSRNHEFDLQLSENGVDVSEERSLSRATENQWYHLAVTFGSGASAIYVNGAKETEWTSGYSSLRSSNVRLLLGAGTGDHPALNPDHRLNGILDDVYIYDRALSASEVSTLYSSLPEPSTSLLFTLGFIGMSSFNRRRKVAR